MALSPQEELEEIELELEIRRRMKEREKGAATVSKMETAQQPINAADTSTTDVALTPEEIGLQMQRNPYAPILTQKRRNEVSETAMAIGKKSGEIALRGGPAAVGAKMGAPFGLPGIAIGGALGSIVGEIAGDVATGEPVTPGKLVGAGASGAIPVGSLASAGVKQIAKESGKVAAGNVASLAAETAIDEGRLPTAGEATLSAGSGPLAIAAGKVFSRVVGKTPAEELNMARRQSFKKLEKEGVKILPGQLDAPFSTAEKASTSSAALEENLSKMNATVWNRLARKALGLPENSMPIKARYLGEYPGYGEINDLKQYRFAVAEPYRKVGALNPDAAIQLEELNIARSNAREAYKAASTRGNPEDWKAFRESTAQAELIEDQIEESAKMAGEPNLIKELRNARKLISQSYAVENATNPSSGIVDAISLGKQLENGAPLTGELLKIADFANNFYRNAMDASRIGSGVSRGMISTIKDAAAKPLLLSDYVQGLAASPAEKRNFASFLAQYLTNTARSESEASPEETALRDYTRGVK